jgi:large subunit ribosomal protein L29
MADLNNYVGGGGKTVKLHEQRDRIRSASEDELRDMLNEVQGEMLNLRTQAVLQQTPNPMRIRQIRKMVARIHTELGARAAKAA